jgi:hypothetical protein
MTLSAPALALAPRADGITTCTAGPAPFAWHGTCATYNGNNTYFGLHGLGFPTPLGFGLCAVRPASGGSYPAPGYKYAAGSAPAGANLTRSNALGWAFSEAQRLGYWQAGVPGVATANQVGAGAKLLYDNVVWGTAIPVLDTGTRAALTTLQNLVTSVGAISGTPSLSLSLDGGGNSVATAGVVTLALSAPGSLLPLALHSITLSAKGATFSASGLSTLTLITNGAGVATAAFNATSLTASSISITAQTQQAEPGLLFYGPTAIILNAQILATPRAPISQTRTLFLSTTGLATGTVQVHKTGDDPTYLPLSDGVFNLYDNNQVLVDTLTTDGNGLSNISLPLPVGDYLLREHVAPIGYASSPDINVHVAANALSTVDVGPAQGDRALRGGLSILKRDAPTQQFLAGASFHLTYDSTHSGVADVDVGQCVTNSLGHCQWNDLLPGWYEVTEASPPANYAPSGLRAWIYVEGGVTYQAQYTNSPLYVTLSARKFNALIAGTAIANATYDLYAATPFPPDPAVTPPVDAESYAGLRFMERGTTDAQGHLSFSLRAGYAWCLHEVSAPPAYIIDPALHCTGILTTTARSALALPEIPSLVQLRIHKFNAVAANQGVPNAYYALFVRDPFPSGFAAPPNPSNVLVPEGMTMWAIAKSDVGGHLNFTIPAGHSWCVRELEAPADYVLDPGLHCTGILTHSSRAADLQLAVPEVLALTGLSSALPLAATLLTALGLSLMTLARRRRPVSLD